MLKNRNEKEKKIIKYAAFLIAVLIIIGCVFGYKNYSASEAKTTEIGFENIGELATQSAYCTEVNVTDTSRELLGVKIPFTQSKYIYSYDFVIKAGMNFEKISWDEKDNKITVKLPEIKILSNEAVDDSFKVFHEKESVFRRVTLEENIGAIEQLKKNAVKDAIANGLYDNARANAETMLTAFFGNVYDMDKYQIEFISE